MNKIISFLKEIAWVIFLSVIIVFPIRTFVAQPFVVSGQSMDNTFSSGSYLIIDEISYRFGDPKRGDVIVFKVPQKAMDLISNNATKKVYFIKRIIGLPGEKIEINNKIVRITNTDNPKGFVLEEPYANFNENLQYGKNIFLEKTLADDEYFVMGDNRYNSLDSRVWGELNKKDIEGRALLRVTPLNQFGLFPGKYMY